MFKSEGIQSTRLLYYKDPYLKEFNANVMAIRRLNGQVGLVLDKTAFYPAGGGQPADTGVIKGSNGEVKIIEVHIEKETVLHIANQIAGKIDEGDIVNGFIDWGRRYS